jgi:hypothetical protein
MTFVVATKKLNQLPQWVRVSEVFKLRSLNGRASAASMILGTISTVGDWHGFEGYGVMPIEWTCLSESFPTTKSRKSLFE